MSAFCICDEVCVCINELRNFGSSSSMIDAITGTRGWRPFQVLRRKKIDDDFPFFFLYVIPHFFCYFLSFLFLPVLSLATTAWAVQLVHIDLITLISRELGAKLDSLPSLSLSPLDVLPLPVHVMNNSLWNQSRNQQATTISPLFTPAISPEIFLSVYACSVHSDATPSLSHFSFLSFSPSLSLLPMISDYYYYNIAWLVFLLMPLLLLLFLFLVRRAFFFFSPKYVDFPNDAFWLVEYQLTKGENRRVDVLLFVYTRPISRYLAIHSVGHKLKKNKQRIE